MPIIHDVEQRSVEWHQLRLGIPTASEFSQLVTPTGRPSTSLNGYAMTLAGELLLGRSVNMWSGNSWTERGREMEGQAVSLYEFAHDAEVHHVGFITNDDKTAGCSPDALIGDDGMIEIKCLSVQNHIAAIMQFNRTGACPPDYVPQTQGQLLLCERKWCDLVFYHPELPILSIRQTARPEVAAVLAAQIPAVIAERDAVLATLRSIQPQEK
jgi:hypothetical protein